MSKIKGYRPHCKECRRKYASEWRAKNPEKARASQQKYVENNAERVIRIRWKSRIKARYGMTEDDYIVMLAAQDGLCAICKSSDPGHGNTFFCVDHNHDTGVVRGLLCKDCNTGIGMLKDSPTVLRSAIEYLSDGDDD